MATEKFQFHKVVSDLYIIINFERSQPNLTLQPPLCLPEVDANRLKFLQINKHKLNFSDTCSGTINFGEVARADPRSKTTGGVRGRRNAPEEPSQIKIKSSHDVIQI